MATLERVIQMIKEGLSESQVINILRQEGVSPKEINDALTQLKIKSTIGQNKEAFQEDYSNMKPSIMLEKREPSKEQVAAPEENTEEVYQEAPPSPEYEPNAGEAQNYSEGYNQNYGYYPEYQPPQQPSATDIETINDIAEQIVEEKNIELKKQVFELKKFKDDAKLDLEKINERLEKLENTFNELQTAILRKIGDYGDNLKNISDEMHMTQDSFSKVLNPLTDNIRELQKITGFQSPKKQNAEAIDEKQVEDDNARKKPGKQKPGFEEYLR